MRPLVLENGAFEPPKVFVLQGFHVEILLRLEDFVLNRAQFVCFDFGSIFGSINAFIEKGFEKGIEGDSKKFSKKVSRGR